MGRATTVDGTLAPGANAIGTLTFNSSLTLNPGSTALFEIQKSTSAKDVANVVGTVTYGGTLAVTLINGFTPAAGDSFVVFDFDNTRDAGTFTSILLPALPAGLAWDTSQLHTTGVITVSSTAGLTFAQWAATVLGNPAATPTGDHDSDGFDNATEFALGLFPPQPGTVFPNGGFHTYGDGTSLRFRFTRPLDRTGITLKVQASADLTTWNDLAVSVNSAPFSGPGFVSENRSHPLNEPGLVEVRDIVTISTGPRRQMRVRIEIAP